MSLMSPIIIIGSIELKRSYSERTIKTQTPYVVQQTGTIVKSSDNHITRMTSSEKDSVHLHEIHILNDPPRYEDVINMPSAPLLEARGDGIRFSSIFGGATSVHFEYNSSSTGVSFLIRASDGSLQAKGNTNRHHTVVENVNGMEMLKIIERSVDGTKEVPIHTFGVVHRHADLGTIKFALNSSPRTSLQIIRGNGTPIIVNSLKIGDYAIFRNESLETPLCNIQMPGVEVANPTEFNVTIIFHPQTGITEEEQLLCTAAAIAFKTSMKNNVTKLAEDDKCVEWIGAVFCMIVILVLIILL